MTPLTVTNFISNQLTIIGLDFQAGATVKLGTVALWQVTVVSATKITAWTPAQMATGVYTLTVTNPNSQSATRPNAVSVIPPYRTRLPLLRK